LWYGCGFPVCQAADDAGADAGLSDDAGTPCPAVGSTAGDTCGARDAANCGVNLECSASDPTKGFGGCPISSRKFKENVTYVNDAELEMLHDEAIHMKLATYNYKAQFDDPNARHLGFIIEDDPRSPAVDRSFDRVDVYGYLSMAVATMQVQEKEIAQLRRELDEARIGSCQASSPTGLSRP
jgi:predicted NUDIX family NTP pyrophosphohydrolase